MARANIHANSILDRRVDDTTTADAMNVLVPTCNTKHDTARKVKQRLSAAMRWAVAKHHRADDPFGTVINGALPMNRHKVKHHKALPHDEVADALRNVDASDRAWIDTKLAFKSSCSRRASLAKWVARRRMRSTSTRRHGRARC